MANISYDTGTVNSIRQMGAHELKSALKGGVANSAKELITLAKSTTGTEDNVLAEVISQNFQVFANLDGKPGLSIQDLDILMLSTDVAKGTNNKEIIHATEQLHSGIVAHLEKSYDVKVTPCKLVTSADAIAVFSTEQGTANFYISAGNIRVLKDKFILNQRGVNLTIELVGKDGLISEKVVELPIPVNTAISTRIRSCAISKSEKGFKLDIYLDALENRVMNGAKVSYSLDSSFNLVRDEQSSPLIEVSKLSTSEVGAENISGLVALGKGNYVAVQSKAKEGLFFYVLKEKINDSGSIDFFIKDRKTSVRNIKLGQIRESYPEVDLSNYAVRAAQGEGNKIYVLLVAEHNKNQHILMTVDKDKLEDSNKTMTDGFEFKLLPSDVLEFSDVSNMAVDKGRIFFFNYAANSVVGQDIGQNVSFDISKLPSVHGARKE
ncbi:MAG: hypothetical protein WCH76_01615 [Candidatus Riflemargulisbacteria bacterium]